MNHSKGKILGFCLVFALLLVLLPVMAEASELVLRISNAGPADESDRTVIANDTFKRIVESRTDGRIQVQTYHASALANERETYEGMLLGTIEMGTLTTGPLPGFFNDIMVLDIPYLFRSNPVAWEVMNGPFGKELSERLLEETGIRALAWSDHGFRHFTNRVRQIHEPEDMRGLKIRTMENPAHMRMVRALGADPTPIAFDELYMSLQQGVVDGQETPITLIKNMRFYEVQDYLVVDGHVYNFLGLFINEDIFQSLSSEDQKIIIDAAEVWKSVQAGLSQVQIQRGFSELADQGMDINFLSSEELAKFQEATQGPVIEYIEGEIGREWIDKIFVAIEEAEKNLYGH